MPALLHSLGRWCALHAPRVLAIWVLLIATLGGVVATTGVQLDNTFSISGTESMRGLDVLSDRLPQAAGSSEQVLITTSDGRIENHAEAVNAFAREASQIDGVAMVAPPFGNPERGTASTVSDDGKHVLVQVQVDTSVGSVTSGTTAKAKTVAKDLDAIAERVESMDSTLTIQRSGSIDRETGIGISAVELVGVAIAGIVLLLTFGSFTAAGLPLIAAFIGVGTGMLGILAAASVTDISSTTPVLAVMIGLAVGIDYALFIVSRAREHLAGGLDPAEAAGRATATSGGAVVFAGTTVIVALCGLGVARIRFLTAMGLVSAAMVAVAVLVALTVVPALIGIVGRRLLARRRRAVSRNSGVAERRPASRWVRRVTRRPWVTIGAVVVLLGLCAVPVSDLRLALTDSGFAEKGSQERETYDAVAAAYGEGYNSPVIVIADISDASASVGAVQGLAQDLSTLDGVESIALATPNQDGTLAFVQVRPEKSQSNPSTMGLVREIRSHADDYESRHGLTDVMVTGQTAVAIDVAEALNNALIPFGIVVIGLSLILLMVVFRSIAVPLTATLGYLLSLGAGMGAVGAVFGWGWASDLLGVSKVGAVTSFLPVIVMGVLFGLAMDYQVFLVSRMREEWARRRGGATAATSEERREAAKAAIEAGFLGSAKVVVAAAVIMIGVFAAFVHTDNVNVKPIAVGLTVGIAADAFLVRMTLIPALMAALGEKAWWLPAWLDRLLPVVDVEGEHLEQALEQEEDDADHPALQAADSAADPVQETDAAAVPVSPAAAAEAVTTGGVGSGGLPPARTSASLALGVLIVLVTATGAYLLRLRRWQK